MPASDPPAVVLLTGAGDVPQSWALVRRELGDLRVVGVERTAGGGADPVSARPLDAFLAEVDAAIAAEGGRALLVGHSFGGLLAQVYAERHPERVAGLVLVDATPVEVAGNKGVAAGFAVSAGVSRMLRALHATRPMLALKALPLYPEQRMFERAATRDEAAAWRAAVLRKLQGDAVAELTSVLPGAREVGELPEKSPYAGPVVLVTSNAYGPEWVRMHDRIAARYPAASHHLTGARNHNIHLAQPGLVAEAIREALAA